MSRESTQLLPKFTAEIEEIRKNGITVDLLEKIITKHSDNAIYNRHLYKRYMALTDELPIFKRQPRFEEEEEPINNKLNNDFFSEIVDFKTGYFAGRPITYGYSRGQEATEETGGEEAVDKATKAITDFVTRNNMYGIDMETTKFASIYGYSGRLFYIDTDGNERVMPVQGYETIILSDTDITEPEFAIRYYAVKDINNIESWVVEFYDNKTIKTFTGQLNSLEFKDERPHLFDYCPLQGIANNKECLGDAEKVLSLIDDYDKVLSDNSNEVEAFVHAYLIFEGLRIDDKTIKKGRKTGSFVIPATGTQQGKAYFLTKNINDSFTEHHLQRIEDNIYRFSKTPNLGDESFGSASGISLKFKLHGLETKCGMYEAQMMNAAQYMWKLLASAWSKKGIKIDPLQCTMDFTRNFPLDTMTEAQTVQALINAGIPQEIAYSQLSFIDDIDYVMELKEEQKSSMPLYADLNKDDDKEEETDDDKKKKEEEDKSDGQKEETEE
jgi:SPP1 family phage portal protein